MPPTLPRRREAAPTPRDIFTELGRYVIGQERARRALAIAAYDQMKRVGAGERGTRKGAGRGLLRKSNVLLIGPTGSGKTHLARNLASILHVPFVVVDATEYTEAGYYGRDVEQMVTELLIAARQDVAACSRGVIFIDEVDKIARRSQGMDTGSGNRDIGGEGVQQGLLKLLEGREIFVPLTQMPNQSQPDFVTVDTTDILFICAGTFSELNRSGAERGIGFHRGGRKRRDTGDRWHRALCGYGMLEEFLGRLPVVVELDPLSDDELLEILTAPPDSIVREYRERLALEEVTLDFREGGLREIVRLANRRGLGARGLRSAVEEIMADVMFEAPELASRTVTIDGDYVRARIDLLEI